MKQRLCDPLPFHVTVDGQEIKIQPFFDNVLDVLSVFDDKSMTDEEKVMYAYCAFTGKKGKDFEQQVKIVQCILDTIVFPDKKKQQKEQKAFDFLQDAPYFYAAYKQSYGIDLFEEQGRLHWWAFLFLFQGLPKNTRMMEIIKIRTEPMPKATKHNAEYRKSLAKAKLSVALEIPQEEREKNAQKALESFAQMIAKMAQQ